jgi:hypothetical protein
VSGYGTVCGKAFSRFRIAVKRKKYLKKNLATEGFKSPLYSFRFFAAAAAGLSKKLAPPVCKDANTIYLFFKICVCLNLIAHT